MVAPGIGIVDNRHMNAIATVNRRCIETASVNWTEGNDECSSTIDYVIDVSGDTFSYDVSIFDPDWDKTMREDDVKHYIKESNKRQELYEAIHVNSSTRVPLFEWSCGDVSDAYQYEAMVDWSRYYDYVAAPGNVSILIYAGQYDMLDGPKTQEPWLKNLRTLSGDNGVEFWNQPRKIYYIKDPVTQEYKVGGFFRQSERTKISFLTVPTSGHFVPITQQLDTRFFLQDIISNGKLTCHKENPSDCETGPIMCKYMDGCSNSGTCNPITGQCECTQGHFGADCSQTYLSLPQNGSTELSGIDFLQFRYMDSKTTDAYEFTISASNPLDIYIMALEGDKVPDVNEFNCSLEIKRQTKFVMRSGSLPGLANFAAHVRVNGANFKTNQYLKTRVDFTFTTQKASREQEGLAEGAVAYTQAKEGAESWLSKAASKVTKVLEEVSKSLQF
jgi:hypothetical protein